MGFRKDLTGQRFGMLTVTGFSHNDKSYKSYWIVNCECGVIGKSIEGYSLSSGNVKSCGCYRREFNIKHGAVVGGKKSSEYTAWQNMRARCANKSHPEYYRYGGRGISVCLEWDGDYSAFLDHVGNKPSPSYQIDRIDNNGNYEPGNVKWSTPNENAQNRRVMSSTGFKGVGRQALTGRWFAKIGVEGSDIYLGTFDTIEEAASAYDMAAIKHYGPRSQMNFPERVPLSALK